MSRIKVLICLTHPNSLVRVLSFTCKICVLRFLKLLLHAWNVCNIWLEITLRSNCVRGFPAKVEEEGKREGADCSIHPGNLERATRVFTVPYNQRENLSLFVTSVAPFSRPQIAFSTGDYPLSPAPSTSWRSLSSSDSSYQDPGMKRANKRLVLSRSPSLASRVSHASDGSGSSSKNIPSFSLGSTEKYNSFCTNW